MDKDEQCDPEGGDGPDHGLTVASGGLDVDIVLCALASIRSAITTINETRLWSRSDLLSRSGVRDGFMTMQSMHTAWLGLVADLDTRPEAVRGARAGFVAQTFIRSGLNRTAEQAATDVRAAHAISSAADPQEGGLPGLGRAFTAGQISREHVDVAVRAMRKIPREALKRPVPAEIVRPDQRADTEHFDQDENPVSNEGAADGQTSADSQTDAAEHVQGREYIPAGAAVDSFFTRHSRELDPRQTQRIARRLLAALDPNGSDGFDPKAHEGVGSRTRPTARAWSSGAFSWTR